MDSLNVLIFGEAGVGKHSVINLIAGKDVARTSPDGWGCTLESERYTFQTARRTFNIWSTIGLGEPISSLASEGYRGAIKKAYLLIQQITAKGGLDLLVFCISGNGSRISQTVLSNYRLFYEVLCEKQIPIALVVTRLETEEKMDDWWVRNVHYLNRCGLEFSGHACVTGLPGHKNAREGRAALEDLLLDYDHGGRYTMPPASSSQVDGFLKRLVIPQPKAEQLPSHLERLRRDSGVQKALPVPLTVHTSFNAILFGEAGVGKSSVINLIAGKKVAETSPDSWRCTLESKQYTFQVARRTFNIWDTTALSEPILSIESCLSAIEQVYPLIQQITAEGGLDLLVFCISGSGSRISQTMSCNYRLFFEVLCEKRIPIALVVTHLETEAKMDDWWVRNVHYLNHCGLEFSGHACVTGLPGHEKARGGRAALEHLLLGYDHEGQDTMPPASGQVDGFWKWLVIIPQQSHLERLLRDRGVKSTLRLTGTPTFPTRRPLHAKGRAGMPSSFNIVLFGEAGVGKSSVVNLIADANVAKTSGDSWGCTLESKQYTFEVAKRTFNIWDTIGLGEPIFSVSNCLGAIEKTHALIKQIEAQGGLDLLLFCIPGSGSRITQTMLCNYRLFFEVFCEKRIPISVVVTRLEGEAKMEEWWNRNEKHISQSGLQFGGHACITGQREHPNAAEGRAALELLLLGYDRKGRYPMPPAADWFAGFLQRLPVIPRSKEFKDKRKEVEKLLRDRCMMGSDDAQKLAEVLTRSEQA